MNTKLSVKSYFFTPFRYIAGGKALILGLILMLVLSVLSYLSETYFDGAIDIHYGCLTQKTPYLLHAWYQLSSVLSLTLALYLGARIFSKSSVRLVDMTGTLALSRIPLIIPAVWGFIPSIHLCIDPTAPNLQDLLSSLQANIIPMAATAIVSIICIVWWFALMYNAFSVSSNLKGIKSVLTFIVGIIVAEILSKVLNLFIVPMIFNQ